MRRFTWTCGLIALLVVCTAAWGQATHPATAPTTAPAENLVEFGSADFGFRLQFPDWLRRMDTNQLSGVALMLLRSKPDPGGTQAQIMVVSPPDIRDPQAYVETFMRAFADARVLKQLDAALDGVDARVFVIQGHQLQGGREIKVEMVVAMRNERLYCVIAMAEPAGFDSLRSTFEQVLASFKWTK